MKQEQNLTLDDFNEIAKKTPQLCKLSPSGEYFIEDLYRAGGVTGVMKRLYENGDLMLMKKQLL